jgi:hypothetical protein
LGKDSTPLIGERKKRVNQSYKSETRFLGQNSQIFIRKIKKKKKEKEEYIDE